MAFHLLTIWIQIAVLGGIFYHYIAIQQFFSTAFQRAADGCPAF